jgi:hypothetical protein
MKIDDDLWDKMCDATICGHEYARRESVEAALATVPEPGTLTELLEALTGLVVLTRELWKQAQMPLDASKGIKRAERAIAKAIAAPLQTSDASAPPADRSMAK